MEAAAMSGEVGDICSDRNHADCPHWNGSGIYLFRFRHRSRDMLCVCGCHADCPVGGRASAKAGDWRARCTCPAGVAIKAELDRNGSQLP
jgi:hypothetical protein